MHTFDTPKATFFYNSDLSGDVLIRSADGKEVEIPGEAMLDFVGTWLGRQQIAAIEDMTGKEVLMNTMSQKM